MNVSDRCPNEWMMKAWPLPRIQHLLLPRGTEYSAAGVSDRSLGSGLITILGTSGSGKSTLGHSLIEWVSTHYPRPVVFIGFSEKWLRRLDPVIRDLAVALPFEQIHEAPLGSVILLDDTGLFLAGRRTQAKANVVMSQFTQIARHRELVIMFTAQSMRVVDFAPAAVAEGCTLIKHYDPAAVALERDEWRPRIMSGQAALRRYGRTPRDRLPFYYCHETSRVGAFPAREWVKQDRISNPMGDLTAGELGDLLWN